MQRNKSAILASTALCLSFATSQTNAADMITKAPAAAAPVAVASPWTGFYVGVNGGYSWGRARSSAEVDPFITNVPFFVNFPGGSTGTETLNLDGGVAGGQIGYTFLFARNWFAGVEADFQWTGQKDSTRLSFSGTAPCTFGTCDITNATDITTKLSWFGTVRGLVGTDLNGLFIYGTFGLAYGRISISGENTFTASAGGPSLDFTTTFHDSTTKIGYAAGLGVGGVLTRDVTWRVEYLHLDLGSVGTQKFSDPPINLTVKTTRVTDEILRVSLNWRISP
jgi:outer membrane immunogenic protein